MRLFIACIALVAVSCVVPSASVSENQKAPDFKLRSPEGKNIQLSKLKGKVVLIDFWASWCRPCRQENPKVVEVYHKYKNEKFKNGKGFVVLSVSLDKKKDAWKKAIDQDGLIWKTHGLDESGEISKLYGVRSIPTAFLVDGDGVIVASGNKLRGLGLHLALDELLK